MQVSCTQMHAVTFMAIIIELIILGAQGAYYLGHPHDSTRLWYIGLLFLMLLLNVTNGVMPDSIYHIPIYVQNLTVTGSAVASYYPVYFYKVFNLKKLRFHAFYGVRATRRDHKKD